MRIPKASEICNVDLIIAPDGGRFVKITFVDGDVQLMPTGDFRRTAHGMMDWAMHLEGLEADSSNAVEVVG